MGPETSGTRASDKRDRNLGDHLQASEAQHHIWPRQEPKEGERASRQSPQGASRRVTGTELEQQRGVEVTNDSEFQWTQRNKAGHLAQRREISGPPPLVTESGKHPFTSSAGERQQTAQRNHGDLQPGNSAFTLQRPVYFTAALYAG